jgi:hypothetical protein
MSSKKDAVNSRAGLRGYVSDWWWPTLVPWFLVVFVDLALLGARVRSFQPTTLILLDACHHLRLLSPLLGWALARSALRRASPPPPRGSWLLTAAAPWWSLAIVLCGVGVSVFSFMLLSAPSYIGFFIAPPLFLIGRIGLEVLWFRRCFRDASRVVVLERSDDTVSGPGFCVRPLDGPVRDVTVRDCDVFSSTVYLMEGDSEVLWKAVGSIEDLTLGPRTSPANEAGKKQDA